LTVSLSRCGSDLRRSIVQLGLILACLVLAAGHALAARVAVVLSDDSAPYQEVYQVIDAYLDDTPQVASRIYAEGLSARRRWARSA
jgi:putative tryptophan/tyrosine transport system substrate-binding protein